MAEAVMVAVRCRPFNKREVAMGAKCIVQMTGPKTTLLDPAGTQPRDFTFDYSYWSFNPEDAHFATNPKVYSDLGVSVLNNAWSGYNCCLFAYGQTGSGKSYSMVGYAEDKGIVPQAMEEMFIRINANKDKNVKLMVEASMMEIYNEKVRDLFNPESDKGNVNGLKVRDNPQTGPYVEDLSRCLIKSYAEFSHLLADGNAVRTIAATQMNATSSRAHTVFQIVFTKTTHDEETNKSSSMTSKINLVDLAGSERVSKTGASGQQLKEGIGINKSLTALGNCIEKLAKKSQVKKGGKEVHVPYRDSVLTWLLKESLGGNAKTIMIAAISPADDNYDESLSTLRYADRAKQIKNSAVVNEDENGRIIRALKAEIQALRDALAKGGSGGAQPESTMTDKEKEEYLALKEQMKQNEEIVKKMNMSWEEKMKESEELAFKRAQALNSNTPEVAERKKRLPHMVNLHKDKLMSECLSYFFPPGKVRLCTKSIDPPPTDDDIILSGLQIKADHATAEHDAATKTVYLTPGEGARVFVNGKLIKERTEIQHNDRIILGAHLVFRVIFPNHATDDAESIFDWEYANKELTTSTIEALNKPDEETLKAQQEQEAKMAAMQAEIELEKQRSKAEQERKQKEYEQTLRDIARKKEEEIAETKRQIEQAANAENQRALSKKLAEREMELERERAAAAKQHSERLEQMKKEQQALEAKLQEQKKETQNLQKKHEVEKRDRQLLEENLMHVIPMVNEANAICTELGQGLRYSIKLEAKRGLDNDGFTEHTDVWIRVVNLEDDLEVLWDMDTLSEALYLMREIYNNYMKTGEKDIPRNKAENPFHLVPNGPMLIGTARLYLQPCYFLLPINESTAIIDYRGEHKGQLYVNLHPVPPRDEDTKDLKEEDLFFEEEELGELKGEPLTIRLEVKKCMGLPQKYSKNVYVQYRFFYDSADHKSEVCQEQTINPMLNYNRTLLVDIVEDEFVEYVKNGILEFSVYGEQPLVEEEEEEEEQKAGDKAKSSSNGSKRGSTKSDKGSKRKSNDADDAAIAGFNARLAKLESVLCEITTQVDPDHDPKTLLETPDAISAKVKELVVKEKKLEEENFVLKSPQKGKKPGEEDDTPAAQESARLSAENARIKLELESLRRKVPNGAGSGDEKMKEENAALKSALESLKSKANPSAVELAAVQAALDEKQRAIEKGESELASLRAKYQAKETEAAELLELKAKEEATIRELEAKLTKASIASIKNPGSNSEELVQLRSQLESARGKLNQITPATSSGSDSGLQSAIQAKDKELEALKKQLQEEKSKKSSTCVIL